MKPSLASSTSPSTTSSCENRLIQNGKTKSYTTRRLLLLVCRRSKTASAACCVVRDDQPPNQSDKGMVSLQQDSREEIVSAKVGPDVNQQKTEKHNL